IDVLGQVVIFLGSDRTSRAVKADTFSESGSYLVHIKGTCFFNCFLPEVYTIVGKNHRATGYATFTLKTVHIGSLQPFLEFADKFLIRRCVERHEVSPATEVTYKVLGWQTAELIFRKTEGNDRTIFSSQTRSGKLLE